MSTRQRITGMRLLSSTLLIMVAFACDIPSASAEELGDELEIRRPFSQSSELFTFGILLHTNTNAWVALEMSDDLQTWSERANIASRDEALAFVDQKSGEAQRRYYRLRVPGTTPGQAHEQWSMRDIRHYRYRIRVVDLPTRHHIAVVEVSDQTKTVIQVLEASTNEEMSEFNPEFFPTVDQLFAELETLLDPELLDARITYDQEYGFPTFAEFRKSGRITSYKISEFEPL